MWKIEIYMFIFMHDHIICHKLKNGVWMVKELMCGQPMTKEARGSIPSDEVKMDTCDLHIQSNKINIFDYEVYDNVNQRFFPRSILVF